jgi:hypothetical protein
MKTLGMVLLFLGISSFAFASQAVAAPEISPVTGTAALALLSGAILVIRGRRKR